MTESDEQRVQAVVQQHRDQGPRPYGSLDEDLHIRGERYNYCSTALEFGNAMTLAYCKYHEHVAIAVLDDKVV